MQQPSVITIDGPAGAGKSTLGALLAQKLGYLYFDTGVMYRALTLAVLHQGIDYTDNVAVERLAKQICIDVVAPTQDDGRQYTVYVDGEDVTWSLRTIDVDRHVSQISAYASVRTEMRQRQRDIGRQGCVVMVGRDIGSVVMPDAELKIYLEATLEERAHRRAKELHARGQTLSVETIRTDIEHRDRRDHHVMQPAPDALILYSDNLSPDHEVAWVLEQITARKNRSTTSMVQPDTSYS